MNINKTFDELLLMSKDNIIYYFKSININKQGLIQFCIDSEIPYKNNMSLNKLIDYISDFIDGVSLFKRITNK